MNKGCLLFAHNGKIDYGSQAVLAARLVKKNLGVPVCLVTDADTFMDIGNKFPDSPFDNVIVIEKPETSNLRRLMTPGGKDYETVEFINANRNSAYDLTPFDRTLVIDTDFLVFTDELNKYWDSPYDFLITPGMCELQENFQYPKEYKLSETTVDLVWATNIMFTKTPETKILFDLVEYIREEYTYFAHLYEFDKSQYRNDFAFTIACHIMSGHGLDPWHGELPVPLFYIDTDEIIDVKDNGQINFLIRKRDKNYTVSKCQGQDVHIMNKRSLLSNLDKLLKLA